MPTPILSTPCKTSAGHTELLARDSVLSPKQLALLRLVDGRRTLEELQMLAAGPEGMGAHATRATLDALERKGLIVKAACVCLPGEVQRRPAALRALVQLAPRAGAASVGLVQHAIAAVWVKLTRRLPTLRAKAIAAHPRIGR